MPYFKQPLTREDSDRKLADLMAASKGESLCWAIRKKDTQEFIGSTVLWNLKPDIAQAEVGYELIPEYHGKGFAGEALEAVLAEAFSALGFQKVVALTGKDNQASRRLLERHNFVEAGCWKRAAISWSFICVSARVADRHKTYAEKKTETICFGFYLVRVSKLVFNQLYKGIHDRLEVFAGLF